MKTVVCLFGLCLLMLLRLAPAHGASCAVDFQLDWATETAFGATIQLNSQTALDGWQVGWTFLADQQIDQLWNGNYSQNGADVTVSNANWNGDVAAGESVSFGFNATGSAEEIDSFRLNGAVCGSAEAAPSSTLALYALAFDTPNSSNNLSKYYAATVAGIAAATAEVDQLTAVALIDLDGIDDTHIYVFSDGSGTRIDGLPDENATLTTTLTEFNMADGVQVGSFLRWARDNYAADETLFSYIGHGTALAPETDLSHFITEAETEDNGDSTAPLPWVVDMNPWVVDMNPWVVDMNPWVVDMNPWVVDMNTSWTDEHTGDPAQPVDLLTPHDLATALAIATDDGADPLSVLDTLHCFGGTIEQLVELSDPVPYAELIVASPSYHYFTPLMIEPALTAAATAAPPDMATALATAYHDITALADQSFEAQVHPRSIVVVAGAEVAAIKTAVDALAAELLARFATAPIATTDLLGAAYQSAETYYDTTYCAQEYTVAPPDALVDITALMAEINAQFGSATAVGVAAQNVTAAVTNAVLWRGVADGTPWFAPEGTEEWIFSAENSSGIAIFTDFAGRTGDTIASDERYLNWLAPFYVSAPVLFNNENLNAHPYRFVQGDATWGDVLMHYWQTKSEHAELTLFSELCAPKFASTQPAFAERVVGVYNKTDVTERNYLPADIPANELTHINYAHLIPHFNGSVWECAIADPFIAYEKPLDRLVAWTFENDQYGTLNQLRLLRDYHPHLRLLFAVGGAEYADEMALIAADATHAQTFATSCAALMNAEQFDGLDLDWLGADAATLIAAFDTALAEDDLLTVSGAEVVPFDSELVDWVNVRSIDFHTRGYDHSAPLAAVEEMVDVWLTGEFSAEKLNLGLSYNGQRSDSDTPLPYWEIALNYAPNPAYTVERSDTVPAITTADFRLTWDDPTSIAAKIALLQERDLGGVTVWNLAGEGRGGSLEYPLTYAITALFHK